ncbi:MAG: type II toxin-antitoxin system HicB family antitoxin [Ruminococcus sp.]|nr:type II toxin-antitoxin system HicB family antitoxin [Ruminococcus sp.]
MKLSYPVCIYPNTPNQGFTAVVPDLPGCVTCGDTMQEIFEMAVDAASGWILTELEDGNTPPIPSEVSTVHADEYSGGFTSTLILDIDAYAEKYGE